MADSHPFTAVFALLSIATLLALGIILSSALDGALESAQSGNAAVIGDWIILGVPVVLAVIILGAINSAR